MNRPVLTCPEKPFTDLRHSKYRRTVPQSLPRNLPQNPPQNLSKPRQKILREKVGSPLKGNLLEEDPAATQNDFEEALEKVSREGDKTDAHLAPAMFHAPELPFSIPATDNSPSTADQKLPYLLRYTSMALENHAGFRELQKDFENALKLRKQAKKLRKMAFEVESLNAESKTISVEQ